MNFTSRNTSVLGEEIFDLYRDFLKAFLFPHPPEIHLVDGDDQMRNAKQLRDVMVCRQACDRSRPGARPPARWKGLRSMRPVTMLRVYTRGPWCSTTMKLLLRRGEIAIRHINRDAPRLLGAQAVGEVGEIDLPATGDARIFPSPQSGLPSISGIAKQLPMSVDLPSPSSPQVLKRKV